MGSSLASLSSTAEWNNHIVIDAPTALNTFLYSWSGQMKYYVQPIPGSWHTRLMISPLQPGPEDQARWNAIHPNAAVVVELLIETNVMRWFMKISIGTWDPGDTTVSESLHTWNFPQILARMVPLCLNFTYNIFIRNCCHFVDHAVTSLISQGPDETIPGLAERTWEGLLDWAHSRDMHIDNVPRALSVAAEAFQIVRIQAFQRDEFVTFQLPPRKGSSLRVSQLGEGVLASLYLHVSLSSNHCIFRTSRLREGSFALDVKGQSMADRGVVHLWQRHDGLNQRTWVQRLPGFPDEVRCIQFVHSEKYLTRTATGSLEQHSLLDPDQRERQAWVISLNE